MQIFHKNGSKERIFEMLRRVNHLNEQLLPDDQKNEIIDDFVNHVSNELNFNGVVPKIELTYDENKAQEIKSFGQYSPDNNTILVVAVNRNLADILRTIAHELKHQKQKEDGELKPDSGDTGSQIENDANAFAGIVLRNYGKNNPIIFE